MSSPLTAPDPALFITAGPFDVRVIVNGVDKTQASPVTEVRYLPDGTGWRRLRDGRTVTGQWEFINPQRTQIRVQGPEGQSRWVIVELTDAIYRKVNMETGVEFIHTPVALRGGATPDAPAADPRAGEAPLGRESNT